MCPCSGEAGLIATIPSRSRLMQKQVPLLAITALSGQVCPSAIEAPCFKWNVLVFWLENLRFVKPAACRVLAQLQLWVLAGGPAGGCSAAPATVPTLPKAIPPHPALSLSACFGH